MLTSTVTHVTNKKALIRTFRRRFNKHFTIHELAPRHLASLFRQQQLPSRSHTRSIHTTVNTTTTTAIDRRLNYHTIPYLRTMLSICSRVELVRGVETRTFTIPRTAINLLDTLPTVTIILKRLVKTRPLLFLFNSRHNLIYLISNKYYCIINLI